MKKIEVQLQELYPVVGGRLDGLVMDDPMDDFLITPERLFRRPAVIVVPGGAYTGIGKREAEPVLSSFLGKGFQTFILTYLTRTEGVYYPEQLKELGCAIDYIKKNSADFFVDPDEIFVVGFSAGGHLTANLAVDYGNISKMMEMDLQCKPAAVGLCYPVISRKTGYVNSHNNLVFGYSDDEKQALFKKLDIEDAVNANTVPSFIWTTAGDTSVPSSNALLYALALANHNIRYELHVYPLGDHGRSVGNLEVCPDDLGLEKISRWIDDCADFFRLYCKQPF